MIHKESCHNCGGQGEVLLCVDCPECKGPKALAIHKAAPKMLSLLKSLELLIRVNATMSDGSPSHKAILAILAEVEV